MAKLRLVQERREDRSENENDLRGLGDKGILELNYPRVFLAITKMSDSLVNQVCDRFGLQAKEEQKGVTVFYDAHKTNSHKMKSVKLAVAAIMISEANPESSMLIGQLDTLRLKMLGQTTEQFNELESEEYKSWNKKSGLEIAFPLNIYLSHAGFSMASLENGVHLSNSEILELKKSTQKASTGFKQTAS